MSKGKVIGRPAIALELRQKITKLAEKGASPYAIGKALGIDRKSAVKYASEAQEGPT